MKLLMAVPLALLACAPEMGGVITRSDLGGKVRPAYARMLFNNANNTRVEIRSPECSSSCGFNLGANDLCVSSYTAFGFHGASNGTDQEIRNAERLLSEALAVHSQTLSDWYQREAAQRFSLKYLSGDDLIKIHGYKECPDEKT